MPHKDPEARRAYDRARNTPERRAAHFAKLKAEVIAAYGGVCAQCGSTDDLQIDHVDGDGGEHRRQVTGNHRCTRGLYLWLRRNGFPNEWRMQVLCHGCHLAKTINERKAAA